jgi:superfamily I DNA/RNA helicase
MPDAPVPLWRRCENAWASFLSAHGQVVTRLADAHGRDGEEKAPLMQMGDRFFRAPDILAMSNGVSSYWEVKQRNSAIVDRNTGRSEYWVTYEAFSDYYQIARLSGARVWIILHDTEFFARNGKWLQADIVDVYTHGRREPRRRAGGPEVDAWVWYADAMTIVDGPPLDGPAGENPVFVREGDTQEVDDELLTLIEEELRGRPPTDDAPRMSVEAPAGVVDLIRENSRYALEILCRKLGLPSVPRYSVMRIGLDGVDTEDLLGLMHYGIRVFVLAERELVTSIDPEWLEACEASRLLERAVVDRAEKHAGWVLDGDISPEQEQVASSSGPTHGYNHGQYMIVHENIDRDVLVRAGAGTGKTETMAERIVFLLATSSRHADPRDTEHVFHLRLDEIALVTFTRDAAREMRERIARTMMLRQRLCSNCVLPTIAWLLELSNTEIETISTYSKRLLQREGSRVGIGPGFRVGELTMEFRRVLDEALSPHLDTLMDPTTAPNVPAAHEFRDQARFLWDKLAGNGFSPLASALGASSPSVDWGTPPHGLEGRVSELLRQAIDTAAVSFGEVCTSNQTIPVSELVATAARAVAAAGRDLRRPPRFLFIDEFQDTDSEQIGMFLTIRRHTGARLFVVGDEKQGIYRFRGAQGNAFRELTTEAQNLTPPVTLHERTLTRNFRSGSRLLDSMHPYFLSWGTNNHLAYTKQSRLEAARGPAASKKVSVRTLPAPETPAFVVSTTAAWLQAHPGARETVAILCRSNAQVRKYQMALREAGIQCEIRVGGDFYQTPVVQDVRVLFEAVLDPDDDAALLELTETRWFPGLVAMLAPPDLSAAERKAWGDALPPMISWSERLSTLPATGRFAREDLESLRARLRALATLLAKKPVLGWLMDCDVWMQPRWNLLPGETPGDVERLRYARGFDHLVTLLDRSFGNAPVSPHRLLEWLRLKIATDETEDEPDPEPVSDAADQESARNVVRVTVLTVHKAKGLEFDRVVIPETGTPFDDSKQDRAVAIIPAAGRARLLWRWTPSRAKEATNVAPADRKLWRLERMEKVREEARLLYVAMTRAREELEIVTRPSKNSIDPADPKSWSDLIGLGDDG